MTAHNQKEQKKKENAGREEAEESVEKVVSIGIIKLGKVSVPDETAACRLTKDRNEQEYRR